MSHGNFLPYKLKLFTSFISHHKQSHITRDMRISCNGCRVLRKGCNKDCTIRPCLQWIKSADSQANATLFLAKFYGRAGLINLIETGPDHLRPAIFKSLLFEACGRIINPVEGSVGLLWSGNWAQCEAAVDAVLNGLPITETPLPSGSASQQIIPPHRTYDIRHVVKDPKPSVDSSESLATRVDANKNKTQTSRFEPFGKSVNLLGECSRDMWQPPGSDAMYGYGHFLLETVGSRREAAFNQGSSNLGVGDHDDINEAGLELKLG